ncbi:MAG: MarR family transcriptional regulator [Rhodospirillaceae bacterium]|nr:MarR family transcriptional regulator [Rhodospirillaceae bacterium]
MTSLVDRLGRAVHCLQFADGLNPAQWAALRYLGRANRYSRTPTAISDYLGTTRGTMSQTIKALEAKGLIGRETSGRDRRAVLLRLTGAGEAALENDPLHCVASVAGVLGDEMDEASRFLDRVVDCLQAKSGGLSYGVCTDCTHFCRNSFAEDVHRCGLIGDPLSVEDSTKICVNYGETAAP